MIELNSHTPKPSLAIVRLSSLDQNPFSGENCTTLSRLDMCFSVLTSYAFSQFFSYIFMSSDWNGHFLSSLWWTWTKLIASLTTTSFCISEGVIILSSLNLNQSFPIGHVFLIALIFCCSSMDFLSVVNISFEQWCQKPAINLFAETYMYCLDDLWWSAQILLQRHPRMMLCAVPSSVSLTTHTLPLVFSTLRYRAAVLLSV